MKGYKDYSVAFAQSLILKTPPPLRATRKGRKRNPWNKTAQRKNDLLKKLTEAEQKHDFYSRLYKLLHGRLAAAGYLRTCPAYQQPGS
ncbi:MAG: hypothetical protein WBE26_08805 [Phycisphaerae bacterium]